MQTEEEFGYNFPPLIRHALLHEFSLNKVLAVNRKNINDSQVYAPLLNKISIPHWPCHDDEVISSDTAATARTVHRNDCRYPSRRRIFCGIILYNCCWVNTHAFHCPFLIEQSRSHRCVGGAAGADFELGNTSPIPHHLSGWRNFCCFCLWRIRWWNSINSVRASIRLSFSSPHYVIVFSLPLLASVSLFYCYLSLSLVAMVH